MRCLIDVSWVLASFGAVLFGVAVSGRASADDQDSSLQIDEMLKDENANLREEVKELRAELRVAAAGNFVQKQQASAIAALNSNTGHSAESTSRKDRRVHRGQTLLSHSAEGAGSDQEHSGFREGGSRIAESRLSLEQLDVSDAIAQDAAAVARMVESQSNSSDNAEVQMKGHRKAKHTAPEVLFVIYSDSKFYDTRVRWARDTWAKKLPSSRFVVIGDAKDSAAPTGVNVHPTRCSSNATNLGMCCKYAEAVVVAQTMMWQHPEIEWAYLADDDTYIRAAALEQALLQQAPSHPRDRGLVLANFGCVSDSCSDLLCGGSGYAANRWAIEVLAGADPAGFVQEVLRGCQACGGEPDGALNSAPWGDAGVSEVIKKRGIERRTLNGVYGWLLDKSCLEFSLETDQEPLLYHEIRTQPQMQMLHRLFVPPEEQTGDVVPTGAGVALDGLGGCVEFRGNVQCAASRDDEDRPWHRGASACKRPRMPRLPVLFGVFTLFLLFGILATLLWTGIKFQHWDGWKMQGVKLHAHHLQGRSRFR